MATSSHDSRAALQVPLCSLQKRPRSPDEAGGILQRRCTSEILAPWSALPPIDTDLDYLDYPEWGAPQEPLPIFPPLVPFADIARATSTLQRAVRAYLRRTRPCLPENYEHMPTCVAFHFGPSRPGRWADGLLFRVADCDSLPHYAGMWDDDAVTLSLAVSDARPTWTLCCATYGITWATGGACLPDEFYSEAMPHPDGITAGNYSLHTWAMHGAPV